MYAVRQSLRTVRSLYDRVAAMDAEFEPLSTRLKHFVLPTKITLIVCVLDIAAVSLVCFLSSADMFLFVHLLAIVLSTSITTALLVMDLQRLFGNNTELLPRTNSSSLPSKSAINVTT